MNAVELTCELFLSQEPFEKLVLSSKAKTA